MKNDLLNRKKQERKILLDIGQDIGFQKAIDYMQLALRDDEAVGKDKWGKTRIIKLLSVLKKYDKHFSEAYTIKKEADYLQTKLDEALREIWGDDLVPFSQRYLYIKQTEYDKPRKGWK